MINESLWSSEQLNASPYQEILNTFTNLNIPLSGSFKGTLKNPWSPHSQELLYGDNLLALLANATTPLSRPYNIPGRFEIFGPNAKKLELQHFAGFAEPQEFKWKSAQILFNLAKETVFPLGSHPELFNFDSLAEFDNKPIPWGRCLEAEQRFLTAIKDRNVR